jgi:phosphoserine phosphatase
MAGDRGAPSVSASRRCFVDGSPTKLHIFDMDGTLVRGSASLHLSRRLGQLEAVTDIEERWSRGEVGHVEFYELCLPLWDRLTPADVEHVFETAEWVEGVADVFADIASRGEHAVVITGSPQFFADLLLRWGVCSAHGAVLEIGGKVDPASVITPESKVTIAREVIERHGLTESDCVAYGDSASDVPLFQWLRKTVAVNASEELKRLAAVAYDGDDFRGAYALGRSLLERGGSCRAAD